MVKQIIILLALMCTISATGQSLEVTPEIQLRNDRSYYLISELSANSIILRDKELEQVFEIFDKNYTHVQSLELNLSEKRARVVEAYGYKGEVYIFFQHKVDKVHALSVHKYSQYGILQDSTMILGLADLFLAPTFVGYPSKDRGTIALTAIQGEKQMHIGVFNLDDFTTDYRETILFDRGRLASDLQSILVSPSGQVTIITRRSGIAISRREPIIELLRISPGGSALDYNEVPLGEILITSVIYALDPQTDEVKLFGYSSDKLEQRSSYYWTAGINSDLELEYLIEKPFELSLLRSVYGQQNKVKKSIDGLRIKTVVPRSDGGFTVLSEIFKTYSRRPTFPVGGNASGGAWVDYFVEDIIVMSYDGQGDLAWSDVLHKKQFSQDDGGIYSSFFVMENPSSIRLIYNDEIKKENTVSEYVISTTGSAERNSLFTTDSEELQLRFVDGMQISANQIVIPSERQGRVSLVRISY